MKITPAQLVACHGEIRLEDLNHLEGNPHRADRNALRKSLDEFGQFESIAVWRGEILIGNHRVDEALELGWETLAGYDFSEFDLSTAERLARALASNQIATLGTDDEDALIAALAKVDDDDLLRSIGFADDDLANLLAASSRQDFYINSSDDPKEIEEVITQNICPKCQFEW